MVIPDNCNDKCVYKKHDEDDKYVCFALAKVLWLQSTCKKMNAMPMESYQSLKVKEKIDFDKPKSKEACFFLYFIFSS